MNGIINNNGDLLMAGKCDFSTKYNVETEKLVSNVPQTSQIFDDPQFTQFHRLVNGEWILINK